MYVCFVYVCVMYILCMYTYVCIMYLFTYVAVFKSLQLVILPPTHKHITAVYKRTAHQIIQSHRRSQFGQQLSSPHANALSDHAASSL